MQDIWQSDSDTEHYVLPPTWEDCIRAGDEKAVRSLIENGLLPDARSQAHGLGLCYAIRLGHDPCALVLLEAGANPNIHDHITGGTALHAACEHGRAAMVVELHRHNADLEITDRVGRTPLVHAIEAGSLYCGHRLMTCGAQTNVIDKQGTPASHLAVRGEMNDLLERIVKTNDRFMLDAAQANEVHCSVLARSTGSLDVLNAFASPAEINHQDRHGNTPLHTAASMGEFNIAKWLIDRGASTRITNMDHKKAVDMICDVREPLLAKKLRWLLS